VVGENIWADTMFAWFEVLAEYWGITKFMIPDVRYPNEAKTIQDRGGKVFRIIAPMRVNSSSLTMEQRQHSGETALDDYTHFDGHIYNDPHLSDTLQDQLYLLLGI
jgi:hypothetical protein